MVYFVSSEENRTFSEEFNPSAFNAFKLAGAVSTCRCYANLFSLPAPSHSFLRRSSSALRRRRVPTRWLSRAALSRLAERRAAATHGAPSALTLPAPTATLRPAAAQWMANSDNNPARRATHVCPEAL